jgi:hypothetical protein
VGVPQRKDKGSDEELSLSFGEVQERQDQRRSAEKGGSRGGSEGVSTPQQEDTYNTREERETKGGIMMGVSC